jgi:hypothetical protein
MNVESNDYAHEVSGGNESTTGNCTREYSCDNLENNLSVCGSCPESSYKSQFKGTCLLICWRKSQRSAASRLWNAYC